MNMKKARFLLLAGLVSLALTGCGKDDPPAVSAPAAPIATAAPAITAAPTETATQLPTEAPTEAPTTAPTAQEVMAVPAAGVYTYQGTDGLWTLTLRENGPYTLQKEGDFPHTGESWAPNGDGTISCGPTDLWNEDFADDYGCSNWTVYPDGRCEPVYPG